jgi:nitrate reductase NapAB chaperone NapD
MGGGAMPICGLVITLHGSPDLADRALDAIEADARFEIGYQTGSRLPVVVETDSKEADRRAWDWLHEQPGVSHVDVVYAHLDGAPQECDR